MNMGNKGMIYIYIYIYICFKKKFINEGDHALGLLILRYFVVWITNNSDSKCERIFYVISPVRISCKPLFEQINFINAFSHLLLVEISITNSIDDCGYLNFVYFNLLRDAMLGISN
jgi:hypothetical protein